MATQTEPPPDTRPAARPSQRSSRWLIAIVFCSLALRLLLLLFRSEDLTGDPDHYVALSKTLWDSGGLCQPGSTQPTANKPPLYPLLLACLMGTGIKSTVAVLLINLSAAVVQIIATWWIARVTGLRGVWPALAAVAAGLDPLLLLYTMQPMTEVLSGALLSAAVLNALKVQHEDAPGSGRTAGPGAAVRAGLCFGLAGLCRPIAFVTCAAVAILLLIGSLPSDPDKRNVVRVPLRHAIALFIVAGVVLTPWVLRNALQFGSFIPATTHGGYTLLLGNNEVFYDEVVLAEGNPVWQADSRQDWQLDLDHRLYADGIDRLDEPAVDRWYYAQARRAINSNRPAFLLACVLRWKRFWALRPSVDSSRTPRWLMLGAAAWFAVLWAGLAGSLFCGIHRRRDIQMLWLAILSFLMIHSFYWTNARMRAPLTGIIVVLATIGWRHGICFFVQKRKSSRTRTTESE